MTRQNAARVEQNAATAKSLQTQAQTMDERVAFFKVDKNAAHATVEGSAILKPEPVSEVPARPRPRKAAPAAGPRGAVAARPAAALVKVANSDAEWSEF